jgi:hypothetical protein
MNGSSVVENKKSKKKIAQQFFASLDPSRPLKARVDELVEYMKIEFVNGQTERVVFNYIRDIVPEPAMPSPVSAMMKQLIRHQFDSNTRWMRGGSENNNNSPSKWEAMSKNDKIYKLLSMMDLYETYKAFGLSNGDYTRNSISIDIFDDKIEFGKYSYDISGNTDIWMAKFAKSHDLIRNHFPFFTREQLESAISNEDLVDISRELLSEREVLELQNILKRYGSAKSAYVALKKAETSSSYSDGSGAAKSSGGSGGLVGITLLLMFLGFLAYMIIRPSTSSTENYSDSSIASDSGSANDYRAESDSSYNGSSSSIRDSMTSETQEKYDNLSPEGKSYVDEQMKMADEFCARNPDFESCW